MAPLLYLVLTIIVGIIVRAYALPIVLRVVRIRHWLYMKFASEKSKEYSEEILAGLPDEIALYRSEGDQNDVIAAKIFLHIVMELPVDIASWVPFIPSTLTRSLIHFSLRERQKAELAWGLVSVMVLLQSTLARCTQEANRRKELHSLSNC